MSAHVIALAATLVLAALARLYRLADIPNGFSPDEASYGYNGYSFLLTVPSIWLFGLDEFAVCLPAVLAGIVTVFVLYKLGEAVVNRWVGFSGGLAIGD